jgi:hypothetical protein
MKEQQHKNQNKSVQKKLESSKNNKIEKEKIWKGSYVVVSTRGVTLGVVSINGPLKPGTFLAALASA